MRRSGFKGLVAAGLVATGIAASTSVVAASDIFLKLKDVTGESNDKTHAGAMEVLAWSWGTSTGTAQTKKGPVETKCIQDLELKKSIDSASPQLIVLGLSGAVIPEGTLSMRKSAGAIQPQDFLTLNLTNVTVLSYQVAGSEEDNLLAETLVLRFESVHGEYRPQKADGSLGTAVPFDVSGSCQ